jgi:NTE family protein
MTRQPFTLALSSGFFGFYAHVGFLKALDELHMTPSSYSGSSAGAIVAAAAARGMPINEIEKLVLGVSRKEFWDPCLGLGLLRGRKMQNLIEKEIGTDFSHLQKPLRISVFDIVQRSTTVFTSGNLARVIRASCAVPVMFHPVRINRRFYFDGGIQDKMAVHGIDTNEKILCHYLESTTRDPHSAYELKRDEKMIQARGNNLTQVQLKGLIKSGPFALDRGPDIIKDAYNKTLIALS